MLRTKRRRWLLACAVFFLACAGVAIAQIVTAQGEDATGARHILRTNASGELITAAPGVPTEVEGTTAVGAAFSDNPVIVGGVSPTGNAQQVVVTSVGIPATTLQFAALDGSSNAQQGLLQTQNGTSIHLGIYSFLFNGITWDRHYVCAQSVPISTAGAGTSQIIALSGTTIIRICHISLSWDAAVDWRIVQGTGANCGTGTANLTADYQNITSIALDFGTDGAVRSAAGSAVCITQAGAGNSGGVVSYAQF